MADLKYEVKEVIATLSENSKGWKKQFNLVSWNNTEPKFDIRTWDSSHSKMGKGVTLSASELKELYLSLQIYYGDGEKKGEVNAIEEKNVELLLQGLAAKAPLFYQELKNILNFMDENDYTPEDKKQLIIDNTFSGAPASLINEVESLSAIYYPFYIEYVDIIKDLNEEQLNRVFNV